MTTTDIKKLRRFLDKEQIATFVIGAQVAILCDTDDQKGMVELLQSKGFVFQNIDTYNYPDYIVVV